MTLNASVRSLSLWVALGIAFTVGAIGGLLSPIGAWYLAIEKPAFQPPDWLFGPAWTTIFLLTAYAAHRLWESHEPHSSERRQILVLFGFNAILNIGWSFLFFYLQRPDYSLYEAFVLWLSIALIIVLACGAVPLTRLLMAPYLAWVTFATVLNTAIYRLNQPFT